MGFPIHQIFVRLGLDTKGLKPAIGGAIKQFSNMGASLQMAGIRAGFMFTAPIMLAAKASFKAVAEFDRNMTRSTAIMGDLSKAMREDMVNSAKTVARDIPKSAAEVAEGFFFLASAGLDAEQSIAAMPAVAKFAVAGAFDLARATSLAADAQSSLGLKSDDAAENLANLTRVTDVLVKANTLANATTEQFSRALTTKAGAAIKIVNKEMVEGVAVLAAFADQGIKAENAGTALNIVFRDLKTKGLKNRVEWQKFGGVFDKVTGKMRPVADIIGSLEEGLGNMSPKMVQAQLKLLGFSDKSLVFTQALIGMSDKIREYEAELRLAGGTTADVADKQVKNIGDQMTIAKQKINAAAIALGNSLMPAFEALIAVMAGFETVILGLAAALELPIIGTLIMNLGVLLAAIGPILIALSMLAFSIKALTFVTEILNMTMKRLLVTAGLVGLVIMGLGAIYSKWKGTAKDAATEQQKLNGILNNAKQEAKAAITALEDYLVAADIGTTVTASHERLTAQLKAEKKALKALEPAHKKNSVLLEYFKDVAGEANETARLHGKSIHDLKAAYNKTLGPITAKRMAVVALEEALRSIDDQMKLVMASEDGGTEATRRSIAQSKVRIATDLLMAKSNADLGAAQIKLGNAFKGSEGELAVFQARLSTAKTSLVLVQKVFSDATKGPLKFYLDLVNRLTISVAKMEAALNKKKKDIVDRESLTMLEDATREIEVFEATAGALNEIAGISPGSPLITGVDMAKEKVKVLEDALADLMEKAVEKGAEVGGLGAALALPEFQEQLIGLTTQLITFNDQIAAAEPFEKAKEHWQDWKDNAGDSITKVAEAWTGFLDDFTSGWGQAVGAAIVDGESFGDAMKGVWNNMMRNFISAIAEMMAQWLLSQIFTTATASVTHATLRANALELIYLNAFAGAAIVPGAGPAAGALAVGQAILGALAVRTGSGAITPGDTALPGVNTFSQPAALPLQHGGIVTNPTLALIGEAGPEAVVPLSGRHGLGGSQHINLYMDGQLVTETVLRNMPDEVRLNIGAQI